MNNSKNSWDEHYKREKSILKYPDENLLRMLSTYKRNSEGKNNILAIDLGCGTGRHVKLMLEMEFENIIGMDMSYNALDICSKLYESHYIQSFNSSLPFKDNLVDIIVCWGGLHYSDKPTFAEQLSEIKRVLKPGGHFMGTLRSDSDTMLKKGKEVGNNTWITDLNDIKNSTVSFYNEEELKASFKDFSTMEYGKIERTPLGKIDKLISHWYFQAVK